MLSTYKRAKLTLGNSIAATRDFFIEVRRRTNLGVRSIRTSIEPLRRVDRGSMDIAPQQNADAAAASLKRNNAAIVRNAIPAPAPLFQFAHDRVVKPGSDGNNLLAFISAADGDGFVTEFDLVRECLTPRIVSVASAYFRSMTGQAAFYLPYNNLLIRRFHTDNSGPDLFVPYHQDGMGFPPGMVMLNCWTPLYPEEVGTTSPGLDLAPVAPRHLLSLQQRSKSKHYVGLETRQAFQSRFASLDPVTPSLQLGDVLMFSGLCLHRTSTARALPLARVSAEIRLFAANEEGVRRAKLSAHAHVADGTITWPRRWRYEGANLIPVEYASAKL